MMPSTRFPDLEGRSILITGGGSGIGAALVEGFAIQGARVAFVDIAETPSRELCDRVEAATGNRPLYLRADLRDIDELRSAVAAAVEAHGPVTVLVNNAANDTRHDWREVTPDYFDARIAVNMRHAFFAIQAVAPGMISAGGGSIVNFGSIGWMTSTGGYPVYATSKASIHGMTRSFARDLGKHGIRVNTLVPGWVMTQRQLDLWIDDAANAEIDRAQCLSGRVMPDDIARMALFLAADDSRMCTAQNFVVDGGWT